MVGYSPLSVMQDFTPNQEQPNFHFLPTSASVSNALGTRYREAVDTLCADTASPSRRVLVTAGERQIPGEAKSGFLFVLIPSADEAEALAFGYDAAAKVRCVHLRLD
jgi:hypothetical protein